MTESEITLMTKILADESQHAWEAGLQNCPGPLTETMARDTIIKALANLELAKQGETELVS